MRIDRRGLLKGSALAGVAAGIPMAAQAAAMAPALVVFDSRLAESADYGRSAAAPGHLDLAAVSLREVHQAIAGAARIEGLTRWSDWTVLRGLLEADGLRRASEARLAAPLSGHDGLWRWSMAAR
jgi:hypothetical protein